MHRIALYTKLEMQIMETLGIEAKRESSPGNLTPRLSQNRA
jgi:hypothetical protein